MGSTFVLPWTKEVQSVLNPAVSQVPLTQNDQYAKLLYLGVTYSEPPIISYSASGVQTLFLLGELASSKIGRCVKSEH